MTIGLREQPERPLVATAPPILAHDAPMPPAHGPHTRLAIRALAASTLAIGVAYASAFLPGGAPAWAPWPLAIGVPLALVSVMSLGAARGGRVPGPLLAAFALVGLMLAGGFALALLLPGGGGVAGNGTVGEPLLLGLPRRAAIVIYGIGLLPVLVLPVAYALTFEAQTLRDDDLERVRAVGVIAAERRARHARDAEGRA